MPKIIVPISKGFEEIEAVSIIDVCRRAGIIVDIAALETPITEGANGIRIEANILIDVITDIKEYDMIVLPGGAQNSENLASNEKVQTLLKEAKVSHKHIGAICAAPYALHTAGVLNKNYTCYPSFESKIRQDGYNENSSIVIDGNVITSRGPGTALCFALQIVKTLCGEETFQTIKKGTLANHC